MTAARDDESARYPVLGPDSRPDDRPWPALAWPPPAGVILTGELVELRAADARLEIGATAHGPAAWGTAVNADAKLALLRYAFDRLRAGRVQLSTDVRNVRSQRAIEALGARYEGTLRRYQRRADGTIRDTAMFAITAEDWPAARAPSSAAGRPGSAARRPGCRPSPS